MNEIEDRWLLFNKCDCCSKIRDDTFTDGHVALGGVGFNFVFCSECTRNNANECDKIISYCLSEYKKKIIKS